MSRTVVIAIVSVPVCVFLCMVAFGAFASTNSDPVSLELAPGWHARVDAVNTSN